MPAASRWRRLRGDERGSVSLFFVVGVIALMMMIGLVVDGGGKVRSLQRADSVAAEAARAGGQAIVEGTAVRGQGVVTEPARARQAALTYLRNAGVDGTVTIIDGTRLRVDTTISYRPVFLGLVGVGTVTSTGEAQVRLVRALDGEIS